MRFCQRAAARLGFAALAAGTTVSGAAFAARVDTPASIVGSQLGSWDCTVTTPGSNAQQLVIVWTPYGEDWIHGSVDVPAFGSRPSHKADFAFGYDLRQKLWVSVYTDSLGAYSVSKSKASPSSRKMTFSDAYPIDPDDGDSIVEFGVSKSTIDSTWTQAGTRHTSHEACSKIPTQ